jgi:hypothetical protein
MFTIAAAGVIAFAGSDSARDRDGRPVNLGSMQATLSDIPIGVLSEQEASRIQGTRIAAKLSRDLYIAFESMWQLPVFASNVFNERIHMEASALLLTRYGLSDPTAGRAEGVFQDAQYQDLYRRFRQEGSRSQLAAINVAMELEELDIVDLQTRLSETDKEDLHIVYTSLLRGNALNLRDLAETWRSEGQPPYEPRFLSLAEVREIIRSRGEFGEDSLLLRATVQRCGKRDIRRLERHQPLEPETSDAVSLRQRACSTEITIAGEDQRVVRANGRDYQMRLLRASMALFPGTADSNSPAVWDGSKLHVFNSWDEAMRSTGDEVGNLASPLPVTMPQTQRPGHVWLEAVWKDPNSSVFYGWYHLEPGDLPCAPLTAPIIGAAISTDGGLTWQDQGFVLEAGYEYDCDYRNGYFTGGHGDFSVIMGPRGEYFYFLFSNYAGPVAEQGVAIARSRVADRGQPGTATKYYRGAWSEPGLGGKVSPLFPSSTGWKGPHVEAFWGPSVHWNAYLQSYVSLLNHTDTADENWAQEGVYITFSTDLVTWSRPEKILETNNWYPQVIGLGTNGTDKLGDRFQRIYVGGVSTIILEFAPRG